MFNWNIFMGLLYWYRYKIKSIIQKNNNIIITKFNNIIYTTNNKQKPSPRIELGTSSLQDWCSTTKLKGRDTVKTDKSSQYNAYSLL